MEVPVYGCKRFLYQIAWAIEVSAQESGLWFFNFILGGFCCQMPVTLYGWKGFLASKLDFFYFHFHVLISTLTFRQISKTLMLIRILNITNKHCRKLCFFSIFYFSSLKSEPRPKKSIWLSIMEECRGKHTNKKAI